MKKLDRITVNSRICTGQPTIRGMRITVSVILKMLAAEKTVDEVLAAYPELVREDVLQAMEYAAWTSSDHVFPLCMERLRDGSVVAVTDEAVRIRHLPILT